MEQGKLDRILDKIDAIDESIDEINITLAKQEVQLAEHIRRTKILEDQVKPIQEHVSRVNSLLLLFAGILAIIGGVKGFLEIINFFK